MDCFGLYLTKSKNGYPIEVETIIAAHSDCEVVIAADLNWDLSRDNHFTRIMAPAINKLGLTSVWKSKNIDFTHTHTDGMSHSTIDHFLLSRRLLELVVDCGPVHRGENLSRHCPIFLSLRLGDVQKLELRATAPPRRMPALDRATLNELENYKESLEEKLQAVQPHRKVAHTCYTTWLCAGKPRQGAVFDKKMKSHARFRYAVRRVKRSKDLHKAQGLYNASLSGDIELMKELRKVKTGKGEMDDLPESVDGATGEREIANKFSEVYNTLYNSAGSQDKMKALQEKIRGLIGEEDSMKEVGKLTPEVVKAAAVMMKPHKMDVSQGFTSVTLLHAPDTLFGLLSLIFRDWLVHGTVSRSVLVCAFIPLLKPGKDPASCDNYRAIAGSSLLLKLFERCVLLVWGDQLHSDSLQFGFKRHCSTDTATWLVQEVLQQYLRQGSKPVAVVLDCTKAFDMAKFSILFSRLLNRGMPAVVVRVLAFSYEEQLAWVRWGRTSTSDTFRISNGTRQESVVSPAFWSVYIDPLFSLLRQSGVGCHIAGVYVVGFERYRTFVLLSRVRIMIPCINCNTILLAGQLPLSHK